jgi:type VI secretion system protein ImpE
MRADELVRSGNLNGAIQAMVAEVRDHPSDDRRRTFLFELLCFAGQFDRAEKHLSLLSRASQNAELGALLYQSAIAAERQRQAVFEACEYPKSGNGLTTACTGTLNGKPFRSIEDLDPRIGARLEVFVAGEYVWLPFEHIGSIHMEPPTLFRDMLWATATIATGPSFKGREFGEVLLPVLSPFSWKHERDEVKLGRATEWQQQGEDMIPSGQKLFLLDGEDVVPILEIRELVFCEAVEEQPATVTASMD